MKKTIISLTALLAVCATASLVYSCANVADNGDRSADYEFDYEQNDPVVSENSSTEEDDPSKPYGMVGTSQWEVIPNGTDEFDGPEIDSDKWQIDNDVTDWGVWSWEDDHSEIVDGILHTTMSFNIHERSGSTYYFYSGIVKSKYRWCYGYYETRMKAASVLPGTCPAFWLKGVNGSQSAEVDVVELPEDTDPDVYLTEFSTNLHCELYENGVSGTTAWTRVRREYQHGWDDPRDDYHIYGCEVHPEYIAFFVDGQPLYTPDNDCGEALVENIWTDWPVYVIPNDLVHQNMNIFVSMGVRSPYRSSNSSYSEGYEGSDIYPVAAQSIADQDLFPTTMYTDYVRSWSRVGVENSEEYKLN
ncbi:MAG: family 16 glycosylhydrolase [Rikenellaceae bacterium]